MAYVISSGCVDIRDRSCIDVCPVDCIYEGARKLYIHPNECVDCGACEPACPVSAIAYADDVPEQDREFVVDNARFFNEPLPGRGDPLGLLGGARDIEAFGVDTKFVADLPAINQ